MKLTAGELSMHYENGFLRWIMAGKNEALRMVYFAVRDKRAAAHPGAEHPAPGRAGRDRGGAPRLDAAGCVALRRPLRARAVVGADRDAGAVAGPDPGRHAADPPGGAGLLRHGGQPVP